MSASEPSSGIRPAAPALEISVAALLGPSMQGSRALRSPGKLYRQLALQALPLWLATSASSNCNVLNGTRSLCEPQRIKLVAGGGGHQYLLVVESLQIWNRDFRPGCLSTGSMCMVGPTTPASPNSHHLNRGSFLSAQLAKQQRPKALHQFGPRGIQNFGRLPWALQEAWACWLPEAVLTEPKLHVFAVCPSDVHALQASPTSQLGPVVAAQGGGKDPALALPPVRNLNGAQSICYLKEAQNFAARTGSHRNLHPQGNDSKRAHSEALQLWP
eukprot:CAMPEP_0114691918 /NCGR_PEP_ID=MMETSP0191-20121206/67358_1 /TAXON_ID=126664 /ORGANISM="Sorites sp." /LENGTH=271 /DNA_ID=CAMNT_0001983681 /DNA_START=441 /DNA_END=1253 /DNA_ORIENTATION=+